MHSIETIRALLAMCSRHALDRCYDEESLAEGERYAQSMRDVREAAGTGPMPEDVQTWLDGYHLMQALEDGRAFLEAAIEAERDEIKAAEVVNDAASDRDGGLASMLKAECHRGALDAYQCVLESVAIVPKREPQAPPWHEQTGLTDVAVEFSVRFDKADDGWTATCLHPSLHERAWTKDEALFAIKEAIRKAAVDWATSMGKDSGVDVAAEIAYLETGKSDPWPDPLTFVELRRANTPRCEAVFWPLYEQPIHYYTSKLGEEAGEVQGAWNRIAESRETGLDHLAEEAADCIIVADLLLARIGRDTPAEVRKKFDAVSRKNGCAIMLPDSRRELKTVPGHKTDLAILERFKAQCAHIAGSANDVHGVAEWSAVCIGEIDVAAWLAQDDNAQALAAMAAMAAEDGSEE